MEWKVCLSHLGGNGMESCLSFKMKDRLIFQSFHPLVHDAYVNTCSVCGFFLHSLSLCMCVSMCVYVHFENGKTFNWHWTVQSCERFQPPLSTPLCTVVLCTIVCRVSGPGRIGQKGIHEGEEEQSKSVQRTLQVYFNRAPHLRAPVLVERLYAGWVCQLARCWLARCSILS